MSNNLENTIISIENELKDLEKRDFNCLFKDRDEELGSKFLKVDYSGPGFGFCIADQSPSFAGVEENEVKKPYNSNNKNETCLFDSECISMLDNTEEPSIPIHKVGSKRNLSCHINLLY